MRMLTWNILTGGGSRLDAIVSILRRERPDLLALQELRGFDGTRVRTVADALGMMPHLARSVFGQPVAVLVRTPLRILRREAVTWRLHHAAAAVTVRTPIGPLTVVSTHLNPFSAHRRYREATWLAHRYLSPVLIAGDLNSLNPHDDHTAALATLDARHRRRHLRPDGTADTRSIAAFESAGLHDLWRAAGEGPELTVPTRIGGAEFGPMRLDYLLGSPSVATAVRSVRVLRDEETAYASDHYPVRADFW